MDADARRALADHLVELLAGGSAHAPLSEAVKTPVAMRGRRPGENAQSPWELLEHLRICQADILAFSTDADYESPSWPDSFWPDDPAPPSDAAWDESARQFLADNQAMQALVRDASVDLLAPIPHGQGQTVLREAMLAADHNAWHLGQLAMTRRLLREM
jgi:hypothetical protein